MRGQKRERIIRVLLAEKKPLSKQGLANKVGCSRQWVILFLRELEGKKLVQGTIILNRKKLIEYWKSIHKAHKYRPYMVKNPISLLKKAKLPYALTSYQAENMVQHYLFPTRTDFYIKKEDFEAWHKLVLKHGVYGGGNVRLLIDDDSLYGKQNFNGLWIVSKEQLIIDLLTENGPAYEAGEMLLQNVR